MLRLLFTNFGMLAGLAALTIPIVIHLLLKRKKQRLRFSTIRFFMQQEKQTSQRRKLRNLLLLAVRLLLLAVLVLAFARPYLPEGASTGAGKQKRLAVLVLDRSASMQAIDGGKSRWVAAQEAAQKVVGELTANDYAALITCGAQAEVVAGASAPEVVSRLIKDMPPGFGTANVGEGLQLAAKLIANAGPEAKSTIHLISDLQLTTCRELASFALPKTLDVKAIKVGDVLTPNVAVSHLQLDARNGERPHVVVAALEEEHANDVQVKLTVDGSEKLAQSLAFGTGAVARLDLPLPAVTSGWHTAEIRLGRDDAFGLDNARYQSFFVPRPLKTLVVETRRGKRIFEEECFFLMSALDPLQGASNGPPSRFQLEKVWPEQVMDKIRTATGSAAHDLVLLPGLKEIPPGLGDILAGFVRGGGGVVFFLGNEITPGRYNNEFSKLLPAQLGHIERNPAEVSELKWRLEDYDAQAPIFAVFRRPGSGNLFLPEFSSRLTMSTGQTSVVSARFGDGIPAVVSSQLGNGRVALVNTSADTAWTDWPKHKTYVPWLHSLCFHIAAASKAEEKKSAARFVADKDSELNFGPAANNLTFRVQRAGDKELILKADDTGLLTGLRLSVPGCYSVLDNTGKEVQRVAVNLPAEESDLTALTANEFLTKLVRAPEAQKIAWNGSLFGGNDGRKDFARFLLLAALVLLISETLLANRTYA